jgi:hypothetical protein
MGCNGWRLVDRGYYRRGPSAGFFLLTRLVNLAGSLLHVIFQSIGVKI